MAARRPSRQTTPDSPIADDRTEVVFLRRRRGPDSPHERLEQAVLCWTWCAGYDSRKDGLRALARALRGLEETGLITRHTVRREGEPPLHGLTLTDDGHACLAALATAIEGGYR